MHFLLTIIMNIVVIINVKSMRSNHFREQSSIEMLEMQKPRDWPCADLLKLRYGALYFERLDDSMAAVTLLLI